MLYKRCQSFVEQKIHRKRTEEQNHPFFQIFSKGDSSSFPAVERFVNTNEYHWKFLENPSVEK